MQSEWQVLVAYAFFGVGFAASGLLSATTLITRWFATKRALALSITSTGLSVGDILITPGSALLIDSIGIDDSLIVFAFTYVIGVVPLTWLLLVSWPADMGLMADGGVLNEETPQLPTGTVFRDSLKDLYFWGLSIAYVFIMLAQVGALAHQYGLVGEYLTGEQAALALGVIPITSIIGRLAGGVLLSYFAARPFALFMMLLQAGSLLLLSQTTALVGFIGGLALFGISVGNLLMLQPLLIAETYGQREYGKIYGLSNMLTRTNRSVLTGSVYRNTASIARLIWRLAAQQQSALWCFGSSLEKAKSLNNQAVTRLDPFRRSPIRRPSGFKRHPPSLRL